MLKGPDIIVWSNSKSDQSYVEIVSILLNLFG